MLLTQFAEENGLVSAADPEVNWRSADVRCLLARHLDEEVGTFAVWKRSQSRLRLQKQRGVRRPMPSHKGKARGLLLQSTGVANVEPVRKMQTG